MDAADSLERVTSSPATSQMSVDQAARRVGDLLIGPLPASATEDSLLLIEPDPLLGNIPWAAVETQQGAMGLHFALEEAPSVLVNEVAPKHEDSLHDSFDRPLVIGASDAAGENTLLPEVLKEARTVASLETDPTVLLAGQATEPRVVERLNSASIIHFAGHATQFDGTTRLLLAPTSSEADRPYLDKSVLLRNPPRHAKLIVFSACSTGKRKAGWNHGMGDIVDTLAYLGVPEVVATRWQIDSASAVLMMDSFYRSLAAGRTVPQALTAARWALIRNGRLKHPYYWAAYYVSGVGNRDVHEVFHGNSK
jgi:CHAT domain-containing protein